MILRKIIKFVVTRCHILKLKCTEIDFGCGSAPDPLGELTVLYQTPVLNLTGHTLKSREAGRGGERRKWGRGRRRGRRETPVPDWESKKVATLACRLSSEL